MVRLVEGGWEGEIAFVAKLAGKHHAKRAPLSRGRAKNLPGPRIRVTGNDGRPKNRVAGTHIPLQATAARGLSLVKSQCSPRGYHNLRP